MKMLLMMLAVLCTITVSAQDEPAKQKPGSTSNAATNAFAKGKWMMPITENLRYYNYSYKEGNNDIGNESGLNLRLNADYFVADNFAVGLGIRTMMRGFDYPNNNESKERSWDVRARFLAGKPITNDFYLYAQPFVGIGGNKNTDKSGNNTFTEKWSELYYGITLGAPIRVCENNVFFTPTLTYERERYDYDNDVEERYNSLRFGVGLHSFLSADEYQCDSRTGYNISRDRYRQGRSLVDYKFMGNYEFGNYEREYNMLTDEGDLSKGRFMAGYNYFVVDHLALGVDINFSGQKTKPGNSNSEFSSSRFSIGPQVIYQLPVNNGWRNFFVAGGTQFGALRSEVKTGTVTNESKDKLFEWNAGIGYRFFVNKNIAFTPNIDWMSRRIDEEGPGDKIERDGLVASLRTTFSF